MLQTLLMVQDSTRDDNVTPGLVGTAKHPAPQRHAALTPSCFPSASGTDSCKRAFHHARDVGSQSLAGRGEQASPLSSTS